MSGTSPPDRPRGRIVCGDVERRRLYEQVGVEDEVEFIGNALDAGRQAEEGEHLEEENVEDVRDETGFDDQARVQDGGRDE